jgi:hypothetical protein
MGFDMNQLKNASFGMISILLASVVLLSGCQTVSTTLKDVSKEVSSWEWPSLGSKAPKTDAKTETVAAASPCPTVTVKRELAEITQFQNVKTPIEDTRIGTARIDRVTTSCRMNNNVIEVTLSMDFLGTLGPAGLRSTKNEANHIYPYFLAVVDAQDKIMAKDVLALSLTYPKGQASANKNEALKQMIPLQPGLQASDYKIFVGFQLTGDELAYNRIKLPADTNIVNTVSAVAPSANPESAEAMPMAAPTPAPSAKSPNQSRFKSGPVND